MKISVLFLLGCMLYGNAVWAQVVTNKPTTQNGCGSDAFLEILRKDATYIKQEQALNLALTKKAQERQNRTIQKKFHHLMMPTSF